MRRKKKGNRNIFYTILGILAIVIISLFVLSLNKVSYNAYACKYDSDCTVAPDGCCGCTAGGSNTAINKNYLNEWNKDIADECTNIACTQVISSDPSCFAEAKCIENKCQLQSNISPL